MLPAAVPVDVSGLSAWSCRFRGRPRLLDFALARGWMTDSLSGSTETGWMFGSCGGSAVA